MADHKVDDGLKKEIEAGKTLKDTPVPETGVNTHDATLAGENHYPRTLSSSTQMCKYSSTQVHKYSSTQVIKYPSTQVLKYPNTQYSSTTQAKMLLSIA